MPLFPGFSDVLAHPPSHVSPIQTASSHHSIPPSPEQSHSSKPHLLIPPQPAKMVIPDTVMKEEIHTKKSLPSGQAKKVPLIPKQLSKNVAPQMTPNVNSECAQDENAPPISKQLQSVPAWDTNQKTTHNTTSPSKHSLPVASRVQKTTTSQKSQINTSTHHHLPPDLGFPEKFIINTDADGNPVVTLPPGFLSPTSPPSTVKSAKEPLLPAWHSSTADKPWHRRTQQTQQNQSSQKSDVHVNESCWKGGEKKIPLLPPTGSRNSPSSAL